MATLLSRQCTTRSHSCAEIDDALVMWIHLVHECLTVVREVLHCPATGNDKSTYAGSTPVQPQSREARYSNFRAGFEFKLRPQRLQRRRQ